MDYTTSAPRAWRSAASRSAAWASAHPRSGCHGRSTTGPPSRSSARRSSW